MPPHAIYCLLLPFMGDFYALRHEMEYFCSLRHAPPSLPLHSFVVDETYLGLQSALFLPRCRSARMTPLLKVMHGPSTSVVLVSRQLHFTLSMEGFRVPFGHIANCVLSIRRDKDGARCCLGKTNSSLSSCSSRTHSLTVPTRCGASRRSMQPACRLVQYLTAVAFRKLIVTLAFFGVH